MLFSACDEESDANPSGTETPSLNGVWELASFDATAAVAITGVTLTYDVEASNMDYALTTNDGTYSTAGSYDIKVSRRGAPDSLAENQSITNIAESGTYTHTDKSVTSSKNFVGLTVEGIDFSGISGSETANYSFNNAGQLELTSTFDVDTVISFGAANIAVVSNTVWNKK